MIDNDEIQRCLNALRDSDTIVVDTEGSGLNKLKNFICGYVFTVGPRDDETWYLPIRHKDGGNIQGCRTPKDEFDYKPVRDDHPLEHELRKIFADQSKHWIGHNIK